MAALPRQPRTAGMRVGKGERTSSLWAPAAKQLLSSSLFFHQPTWSPAVLGLRQAIREAEAKNAAAAKDGAAAAAQPAASEAVGGKPGGE